MTIKRFALDQPISIFLPWRNPRNNFQVSGNPCINIITSTAHGRLAWSVSCRYNNPIIIFYALLSREWYFSVDLFILAKKFKKLCLFFQSRSLAEPLATSRGTPIEKPCSRLSQCVIGFMLFLYERLTILQVKAKLSHYTPWRRLGREEV
jgi:hypothetical protein